jgi:acetyl esterase/lipase
MLLLALSAAQAADIMTVEDLAELEKTPPGTRIDYGPDPLQFGELTLPEGDGPFPVVVNVHGGCWLSQYTIPHSRALAKGFADAGYAVWNIEYRRVGDAGGGWPGTFLDVARAADHVRTLAASHPLDLDRVIVAGHSAGGHFALWLAARAKLPKDSEVYTAEPLRPRGVLSLAPAPQLERLHELGVCDQVIDKLLGGSPAEVPERYRSASPAALAPLGLPQVIVLGLHDADWEPIGRAYLAATAGDAQVRVVEAPDSGHFEMINPQTSTWPLVLAAARSLLE